MSRAHRAVLAAPLSGFAAAVVLASVFASQPSVAASAPSLSRPADPQDLSRARSEPLALRTPRGFAGVWHEAEHGGRASACVVFDSRRRRLVEFSGEDFSLAGHASVWTYDPQRRDGWHPLVALGSAPSRRVLAAAIYDSLQDRIVVFGGASLDAQDFGRSRASLGDFWELDLGGLPRWRRIVLEGPSPAPRFGAGVAVDTRRHRMILTGGGQIIGEDYDGGIIFKLFDDVWTLSLDSNPRWDRISTTGSGPEPALYFTTTYDPDHDALILLGGVQPGVLHRPATTLRDVWKLSLESIPEWRKIGIQPPFVAARFASFLSTAFDSRRRRVVVYSGADSVAAAFRPDDANDWVRLGGATNAPGSTFGQGMVLDDVADEILLTGLLQTDDVWRIRPEAKAQWTRDRLALHVPQPTSRSALCEDPTRGRMILSGGLHVISVPHRTVTAPTDEIWSFDLIAERWTRLDGTTIPRGGLSDHRVVRDARRDRMLLLGGNATGESLGVTTANLYLYSLPLAGSAVWDETRLGSLPGRLGTNPRVVVDERGDRLVLQPAAVADDDFEGTGSGRIWLLPLSGDSVLSEVSPAGEPLTSAPDHVAIYDPNRERIITEGGPLLCFGTSPCQAFWSLDLHEPLAWQPIVQARQPLLRQGHFAALDAASDRMVIFGGRVAYDDRTLTPVSDVLAFSLGSPMVWDSLDLEGPAPDPGPTGAAVAFDPELRKLVVTRGVVALGAGTTRTIGSGSTYVLDFNPPARHLDLLATRPGAGESHGKLPVAILSEPHFDARTLDPTDLRLDGAPVARAGSRWKTRALDANGDGLLDLECTFAHRGPVASKEASRVLTGYDPEGYPLDGHIEALARRDHEDLVAATPVEVSFALEPPEPNPSTTGRLDVRFVLPTAEPATLDLIDLAGRVIEHREAAATAGRALTTFGTGARLAPGLYWLRLRQGARIATTRAVVLR